jgi:hypothetical protein
MPRPITDRALTPIHIHRSGTTPNPVSIMRSTYKQRKCHDFGLSAELALNRDGPV